MLCSAAGRLEEAANLFERALARDPGLGIAEGFAGYNAAFLGHAEASLPASQRAMRLDRTDRRRCIFLFFGGFGELLLGRTEAAIALLEKSLERNPGYGAARLFTGGRAVADRAAQRSGPWGGIIPRAIPRLWFGCLRAALAVALG